MFANQPVVTRGQCALGLVACFILLGLSSAPKALAQAGAPSAAGEPSLLENQGESPLPGLVATIHDDSHSVSLVTPTPNFYLAAGESLHPSLSASFEAEWKGLLSILRSGHYVFAGDGAEIYLGGNLVPGAGVELETGRHPVTIRYRREPGEFAQLRLRWKAAHFPMEPIPRSRFSHAPASGPSPHDELAEKGRLLAEELGCVNCHRTESSSLRGRQGPDLTSIGSRVSSRWLYHWLGDPQAFRPGSAMPRQLDEQQRRDVTSYLLSLGGGGDFEHKRMSNERGPYFGRETYSTIGCAACHEQPGLLLEGMGSKISLEALTGYLKDPLRFDPGGRMPSMMLSDEEAYNLAAFLTRPRNEVFEQPWEPGDVARGRSVVQSAGCLSCHALKEGRQGVALLENKQAASRLEELSPERGCLADEPSGVPVYDLRQDDRSELKAFLGAFRKNPDRSAAPVHDFRRRAQQLRCVACHETDHGDATAPLAEKAPSLADAGAKLRRSWISDVMTKQKRARTEGDLRMPHYGPPYAAEFSAAMAKVSGAGPNDDEAGPAVSANQESSGVGLLGSNSAKQGMSCIGCHGFGEHAPLGEDGPHLSQTAERLRFDWFRRWMGDPARILSGTSMPNYFSSTPPEQAGQTIETLWAAFSMGARMPLPDGFRTEDAPPDAEARPIPGPEAIVIRFYMPEATPAAIAVGLPDNVSYCFDAGEVRLRYAWLGGFVDMTGTLFEKRDSVTNLTRTVDLLGDIFYRTTEFPIRIGSLDRIPQRRFRGYRMIDGRPRFHYQVDGIDVYETVAAADGNRGIVRQFTIARVEGLAWFLVGNPEGVLVTSTLGQAVEGKLEIPRGRDVRFDVTIIEQGTN